MSYREKFYQIEEPIIVMSVAVIALIVSIVAIVIIFFIIYIVVSSRSPVKNLTLGSPCSLNKYCAGGLICNLGKCAVPPGGSCGNDSDCASIPPTDQPNGLTAISGKCLKGLSGGTCSFPNLIMK